MVDGLQETGVSRRMDGLGRIVVPMGIRRMANIADGDAFQFYIGEGGRFLLLRRVGLSCDLCGEPGSLVQVGDRHICQACLTQIRDAACAQGE